MKALPAWCEQQAQIWTVVLQAGSTYVDRVVTAHNDSNQHNQDGQTNRTQGAQVRMSC